MPTIGADRPRPASEPWNEAAAGMLAPHVPVPGSEKSAASAPASATVIGAAAAVVFDSVTSWAGAAGLPTTASAKASVGVEADTPGASLPETVNRLVWTV